MKTPAPILALSTIEAFRASLVLRVARLMAGFFELSESALPKWLKRFFRERVWILEKHAQVVLFLLAGHRARRVSRIKRTRTPRSAHNGARLKTTRGSAIRRFTRTALRGAGRGTLAQRMHRIVDALTYPERHIARCVKHMARGLVPMRLVAAAPVALMLCARVFSGDVAASDSS